MGDHTPFPPDIQFSTKNACLFYLNCFHQICLGMSTSSLRARTQLAQTLHYDEYNMWGKPPGASQWIYVLDYNIQV